MASCFCEQWRYERYEHVTRAEKLLELAGGSQCLTQSFAQRGAGIRVWFQRGYLARDRKSLAKVVRKDRRETRLARPAAGRHSHLGARRELGCSHGRACGGRSLANGPGRQAPASRRRRPTGSLEFRGRGCAFGWAFAEECSAGCLTQPAGRPILSVYEFSTADGLRWTQMKNTDKN